MCYVSKFISKPVGVMHCLLIIKFIKYTYIIHIIHLSNINLLVIVYLKQNYGIIIILNARKHIINWINITSSLRSKCICVHANTMYYCSARGNHHPTRFQKPPDLVGLTIYGSHPNIANDTKEDERAAQPHPMHTVDKCILFWCFYLLPSEFHAIPIR